MNYVINMKRCALMVILLLCLVFTSCKGQAPQIPAGLNGKFISVHGMQIRYHQLGSGPDILLIHGLPGSIEDWQPVIAGLASRYRVTAYDRPGNGLSSAEGTDYSISRNAEVAFELIELLHLDNPVVVGHSYGGSIALEMALMKPGRIKAFVDVAGGSYPGNKPEAIFSLLRIPALGRVLVALIPKNMGHSMIKDGIMKAFNPNMAALPGDYVDSRYRLWSHPMPVITMAREETRYNNDIRKIVPRYQNITASFFLVHGRQDGMVGIEQSRRLSKVLPNALLTEFDNTGHMVQFARAGELIQIIMSAARVEQPRK